jgi:hypothetical protein
METSFYKFRKYKVYDRDDDRFGPHLYLQPYSQVVHIGVLPLMCCAALFIDPENSSLQRPIVSLSGRLSLGAQPSRSRPPWVELIRFSPSLPQTGALCTPGVRLSQGQQKSRLLLPSVGTLWFNQGREHE